jgi:hypothetical protein
VQFTIGQDAHDLLRRLQTLLRREIPDGDAGAIFERGLRLLHEQIEAAKFGKGTRQVTRRKPSEPTADKAANKTRRIMSATTPACDTGIRPGADPERPPRAPSRYIPKNVKREVWYRDRGQCAFVSPSGRRCVEQEFLELHHIQPYALKGPTTAANLALRCRRHNAHEAERVFGARGVGSGREGQPPAG